MYIITGGAGFLGSAMLWQLNNQGIENIIVVDNLGHSSKWKNLVNRRYEDYIHKDTFIDLVRRDALPFPVSAVVHLGACSSTTETDSAYLMENNFHYSRDLCLFALQKGARFIHASSAATYGDGKQGFATAAEQLHTLKPLNMYGYSKQLFDLWLVRQKLHSRVPSLKFFNVYGPNEYHKGDMCSVVCKAHKQILERGVLRLFRSTVAEFPHGGQMRDFVYVKDCAALMDWLLHSGNSAINGVRNVGTGRARTWNDLASAVFAAMGRPPQLEYVDMPDHLQGKYQNFTQADMDWLKGLDCPVQWHSLEDGVRDYVGYLDGEDPYL